MGGWWVRSGLKWMGYIFLLIYAPRVVGCTILAFEGEAIKTCRCCRWRGILLVESVVRFWQDTMTAVPGRPTGAP